LAQQSVFSKRVNIISAKAYSPTFTETKGVLKMSRNAGRHGLNRILAARRRRKIVGLRDAKILAHIGARWDADREIIRLFDPQCLEQIAFLDDRMPDTARADTMWRLADIILWLNARKPEFIVETGSGRSSIIFASYAARHGFTHVALEESYFWKQLVEDAIRPFAGTSMIRLTTVGDVSHIGMRYRSPIDESADFLYVDGPAYIGSSRFLTYKQKAVCLDAPHHLEVGHRPRTILLDGRLNTFLFLTSMQATSEYEVESGYQHDVDIDWSNEPDFLARHASFTL